MKVISVTKENILLVIYVIAIAAGLAITWRMQAVPTSTFAMPLSKKIVLIDAGHGGYDPGKVSGSSNEKDINLNIAKKLQAYLETADATVIMSRVDDTGVKSKKSDMYTRKLIANSSSADIFVSIHQNSFPNSGVHGAQVFYFNRSDNSKKLAENIQKELKGFVDYQNKFEAKENSNYYVLKQTSMPAVIVECGFLTNAAEKAKLLEEDYQDRLAWAIYMGIVDYFTQQEQAPAPVAPAPAQTAPAAPATAS
ncbi:MAG: N-acetylmuramoyl-L-alanine amidase [Clostridiales bacterium]|jgi:N-acetylmuramoyl-L-alanine amidase|nr:N-acetylmuramoyl-L-alanine amidase [Clostridiales bacterium]